MAAARGCLETETLVSASVAVSSSTWKRAREKRSGRACVAPSPSCSSLARRGVQRQRLDGRCGDGWARNLLEGSGEDGSRWAWMAPLAPAQRPQGRRRLAPAAASGGKGGEREDGEGEMEVRRRARSRVDLGKV